jgi:hypothetical protein
MESEDASWYSSLKEELYPEKENELRRSVSVYVESICLVFASIYSHLFQSISMESEDASWCSSLIEEFFESTFFFLNCNEGQDDSYEKAPKAQKTKRKMPRGEVTYDDDVSEKAPNAQRTKREMPRESEIMKYKTPRETETKNKMPLKAEITKHKTSRQLAEQMLGLRQRKRCT